MACNINLSREEAILFPCATCNLQCSYCTIDKSPALQEIDELLALSFENENYYFNRIKEYFPQPSSLRRISTWGGEPFLHMERIYNTLHKVIDYYPYFDFMFCSTNFSYPSWKDKVFDLFAQFKKYPYRQFNYQLQLSCDGPREINDRNRGKGTTEKCLNNYASFVEELYRRLPQNVNLSITIKPTLNMDDIEGLTTKESIIDYYTFFEKNFLEPIRKLNYDNVNISDAIPNTAVPSPVTIQDGKNFALFCKFSKEIEQDITKYFRHYSSLMPYQNASICEECGYECAGNYCGSGQSMVGFLPNNYISTCDAGFVEICESYKKNAKGKKKESSVLLTEMFSSMDNLLCLTDEEYKTYESHLSNYMNFDKSSVAGITNQIILAAMSDDIDKKYLEQDKACYAAQFLRNNCHCVKDNFEITGSVTLIPIGLIRLLLNGAIDYLV